MNDLNIIAHNARIEYRRLCRANLNGCTTDQLMRAALNALDRGDIERVRDVARALDGCGLDRFVRTVRQAGSIQAEAA